MVDHCASSCFPQSSDLDPALAATALSKLQLLTVRATQLGFMTDVIPILILYQSALANLESMLKHKRSVQRSYTLLLDLGLGRAREIFWLFHASSA